MQGTTYTVTRQLNNEQFASPLTWAVFDMKSQRDRDGKSRKPYMNICVLQLPNLAHF